MLFILFVLLSSCAGFKMDEKKKNQLHDAIKNEEYEEAVELLDRVNIDSLEGGMTPLALACSKKDLDSNRLVEALLEHGANPNACWPSPLYLAVTRDSYSKVNSLIKKGADIYAQNGIILKKAIDNNNDALAELLIENEFNPQFNNFEGGKTALMIVQSYNLAERLVDKGADVNARDENDTSVLMHLFSHPERMRNGFVDLQNILDLFISRGVDLEVTDSFGKNLLSILDNSKFKILSLKKNPYISRRIANRNQANLFRKKEIDSLKYMLEKLKDHELDWRNFRLDSFFVHHDAAFNHSSLKILIDFMINEGCNVDSSCIAKAFSIGSHKSVDFLTSFSRNIPSMDITSNEALNSIELINSLGFFINLIKRYPDLLEARNHEGKNLLMLVCGNRQDGEFKEDGPNLGYAMLNYLKNKKGFSTDVSDFNGLTAFSYAIQKGNWPAAQVIGNSLSWSKPYIPNIKDIFGNNAVIFASRLTLDYIDHADRMAILDHFKWLGRTNYKILDSDGRNIFMNSIISLGESDEDMEYIKRLGCFVNAKDNSGSTALMHAVKHPKKVRFLLKKRANPFLANDRGESALYLALKGEYRDSINMLLSPDAMNYRPKFTLRNLPDRRGRARMGRRQLEEIEDRVRNDIDHFFDSSLNKILFLAIDKNNIGAIEYCLNKDISIDVRDSCENTPLIAACYLGNINLVRKFLQQNPNLDLLNNNGDNAYIAAVCSGNLDIVRLLSDRVFNREAVNVRGNTAFMEAIKRRHINIARFIWRQDRNVINLRENNEENDVIAMLLNEI